MQGATMNEHLRRTFRMVKRIRQDYEATRLLCQRQREMMAAQREFLKALNQSYAFMLCENPAQEEPAADRPLEEELHAGE
jgi:hypothetical protein